MTLNEIIEKSYEEDIPSGDLTTKSLNLSFVSGKAHLIAKEDLVLSGSYVFENCILHISPKANLKWYFTDSDFILKGQTLCLIESNLIEIIKAERVALNFLGRLSGIATLTRCFVNKVSHTSCKILDTRKTTPLLRDLEKQAVLNGGGCSHRRDLSSAILIKENHIELKGSLRSTLETIKHNTNLPIEVEVKSLDEVKISIQQNVQRLLLDNMDQSLLKDCLEVIPNHIETEASGNMSLDRVGGLAELGLNFISVGALTHSAPCADFSLLFK